MTTPAEIAQPGYDPYADTAGDVGWFGSDIAHGISKAAKGIAHAASKIGQNPIVKTIAGAARTALKNSGPWGMVANGAISALDAGLSGKNVAEIGLAAAQGAAPSGIDVALKAGVSLAKGENVLKTAVIAGADAYLPNSGERFAYSVAVDALKKGATKVDLGTARRALANEGQRRAFDSAVGMVAKAAIKHKIVKPTAPKGSMKTLFTKRPTVNTRATLSPRAKGRGEVAVKSHAMLRSKIVRWKKISPRAMKFVLSKVPHAPRFALVGHGRDTGALSGGLSAATMPTVRFGSTGNAVKTLQATLNEKRVSGLAVDGKYGNLTLAAVKSFQKSSGLTVDGIVGPKTWGALDNAAPLAVLPGPVSVPSVTNTSTGRVYTVLSGDFAGKIAQKFTGVASRYLELLAANPQKPTVTINGVKNFKTLFAGEKLFLPASWPSSPPTLASTAPAPALPSGPAPVVTVDNTSAVDSASVLQAKSILVAWSKTDGLSEAGVADYGTRPEDMSTTFGPRDKFVCASFCKFANRTMGKSLNTTGELTPAVADALREWAEKRAAIAGATPSLPTITTPGVTPGTVTPGTAITKVPSSFPTITTPGITPGTVTPSAPAKKGDNALVLAGGGAALGYLMGGPIGALIGAAGGAISGGAV